MDSSLLEIQSLRGEGSTSSILKSQSSDQNEKNFYGSMGQAAECTSATIPSRNTSFIKRVPIVDEYFRLSPVQRLEVRKKTAAKIKSIDAVFAVLDWSLKGDTSDTYSAAVDLLAECNVILIGALQYFYLEYSRTNKSGSQIVLDSKFDVLINGLARGYKLSAESRLKAIIQVSKNKSRIVKAAIIDGSAILVNKRNKKSVQALLNWFITKDQDDYIRQYAQEVLDDLN